jgi:hypothetical protein
MSNSRKLRQANGGKLTRPPDQWGPGKFRTGERQGAGTASALWRRAQRAWASDRELAPRNDASEPGNPR